MGASLRETDQIGIRMIHFFELFVYLKLLLIDTRDANAKMAWSGRREHKSIPVHLLVGHPLDSVPILVTVLVP